MNRLCWLLIVAAMCGCPPSETTDEVALQPIETDALPADGEPVQGGTLIYGRGQDAVRLDPADVTDGESVKVIANVFETLVRYKDRSTEVEPCLATSWEVSDDQTVWTFTLREGVTFHDGTALTPEAVVWSFERQRDTSHPAHTGEFVYWQDQFSYVQKVEAGEAANTVVFHLNTPFVPFLTNLAMFSASIISPASFAEHGEDIRQHPVGTGPFQFEEWRPGEAVVLTAFEGHWEQRPYVDRLVLKVIPDNTTRLQELRNGQLHGMDGVNSIDVPQAQHDEGLRVIGQPGLNVAYLAFNNQRAPFDDPKVREACALALNLDSVAERYFHGLAAPAANPLPPTSWGHNDDLTPRAPDRERAKELLAEAGHADGLEVELYIMSNPRPYLPEPDNLAQYVKGVLGTIGVKVTIEKLEWNNFLEQTQNGAHDMCFLGWTGDTGDPDNFLYVLLDKENAREGSASNVSFYTSDVVHDLLGRARTEPDQAARKELYREAQAEIHRDVPMVPLVHNTQLAVFRDEVRGFALHPTGLVRFHRVWLAD